MQTKKQTHYEVITNQVIGIVVGWVIVAYILIPLSNIYKVEIVATISTGLFFVSSYIRSYLVRRWFNGRIKI